MERLVLEPLEQIVECVAKISRLGPREMGDHAIERPAALVFELHSMRLARSPSADAVAPGLSGEQDERSEDDERDASGEGPWSSRLGPLGVATSLVVGRPLRVGCQPPEGRHNEADASRRQEPNAAWIHQDALPAHPWMSGGPGLRRAGRPARVPSAVDA